MSGDATFEAKFAKLAFTQISERVPSLQKHYKGFQLLDKSDDESEAVGIAAFLVNDLFLYIPIFFLEGDLKGAELLYIYQHDMFVPSTDAWISTLKKGEMKTLGKLEQMSGTKNNFSEPGQVITDSMNIDNIRKMASVADANLNGLVSGDVVSKMFRSTQGYVQPQLSESLLLLDKSASLAACFFNTCVKKPELTNAMCKAYNDLDAIKKVAADVTKAKPEAEATPEPEAVAIITSTDDPAAKDLELREKDLLIRNGVFIVDKREQSSDVFRERINDDGWRAPQHAGVYDVLLADGTTERMFALPLPKGFDYRYSPDYNKGQIGLVRVSDPSIMYNTCKDDVHVRTPTPGTKEQAELVEKFKTLTNTVLTRAIAKREAETDYDKRWKMPSKFVLIEHGLSPVILDINDCGGAIGTSADALDTMNSGTAIKVLTYSKTKPKYSNWERVTTYFSDRACELGVVSGTVLIPADTKYIQLQEHGKLPFELGSPELIQRQWMKQASADNKGWGAITLHCKNRRYRLLTGRGYDSGPINKLAALEKLVLQSGIGAANAQRMLVEAEDARQASYVVKYAAVKYSDPNERSAVPYVERQAEQYTTSRPELKMLSDTAVSKVDQAVSASQAGVREVFDTEVLKQLLDISDIAEPRRELVAKMMEAVDANGRLLFLYYWHRDSFEERYGTQEATKLAGTLLTVFESQGDLVLYLREKMSDEMFGMEGTKNSLSEDIGTTAEIDEV